MSFYKRFTLIFFLYPVICYSQTSTSNKKNFYRFELSIVNDNDVYTLQPRDGYYTNGLYLKFSYATNKFKADSSKQRRIKKIINGVVIGQAIYNPMRPWYILPAEQDMPYSAYLSFSFDKHIYYADNNILELAISIGTIGPNAFGEEVQRGYHKLIGLYDVVGWDTQLKSELNLNMKASFIKSIINANKANSCFNVDGFVNTELGNAHTNVSFGTVFRAGRIENNWNSSHWRARITTANSEAPIHPYELYVFYQPSLTIKFYDATIQGGLFTKDKGPLTKDIKRVVLANQLGIRFAKNRWTTAFIYVRRSKNGKTQIRAENYGSIQFSYRFKQLTKK